MGTETKIIQQAPGLNEIQEMSASLVEQTRQGVASCDALDFLIKATDKANEVIDTYKVKSSCARKKLLDLAVKL